MSILDGIKGLFGGGSSGPARVERNTRTVYIVDVDHIQEGRGNPGPAERAGLLQRLAQFAQREEIRLQVVIGGRPLREAAHGEEFNGIMVYYAEQGGGMADQIAALYSKAGGAALVITSDREVEQKIEALGGSRQLMKGSTLRKALENEHGGDEGGRDRRRDRGGRGDRGDRGDRRDRREPREPREPRESREPRPEQPTAEETSFQEENESSGTQSGEERENTSRDEARRSTPGGPPNVKNLIDLVE